MLRGFPTPVGMTFVSRSFPGEYHGRRLGGQFHSHFLPLLKVVGLTGAYAFYAIAAAISLPFCVTYRV